MRRRRLAVFSWREGFMVRIWKLAVGRVQKSEIRFQMTEVRYRPPSRGYGVTRRTVGRFFGLSVFRWGGSCLGAISFQSVWWFGKAMIRSSDARDRISEVKGQRSDGELLSALT